MKPWFCNITRKCGFVHWVIEFALACALCLALPVISTAAPVVFEDEAPRVRALLDQAWAAESGRGLVRDMGLAALLYRQAGDLGSAEGYYRASLLQLPGGRLQFASHGTVCLLATASQLGHVAASQLLERILPVSGISETDCDDSIAGPTWFAFDMQAYVNGLSQDKQRIAATIRRLALAYRVDPDLAVAIASAESNFNPRALSPKMAMGVMQLIPETAERFNVRNPYDTEQNIRGGLAYLRWLKQHFGGDVVRMVAAYNAGEGAVMRYDGVPPYRETLSYVARVMSYSGLRVHLPREGATLRPRAFPLVVPNRPPGHVLFQ